jgi:hypothetical protein
VSPPDGIVMARDRLRVLDSRSMPWRDHPGLPGAKRKVLIEGRDGRPELSLSWVPPGLTSFHPDGPERHFHRTVTERMFIIAGEISLLESESLDGSDCEPVTYRAGYLMDRAPGSVHGIDPERPSPVGLLYLEWTIGEGAVYAALDPNDTETERTFL